jgi:hypothetical protein
VALAKVISVAIRKPSWIWWNDALRHVSRFAPHQSVRWIASEGGDASCRSAKRCPYHPVFCVSGPVQMSLTRYARELSALADTYREALAWDADDLVRVVGALATQALRVTGSGGSYSLAAFCARLHASTTGQAAMAATPLEVVQTPYLNATGLLCLTASGRNKDIRAAFEASALAETKPTAALCLVRASPLKGLHERHGFTDLVEAPLRIAPDGFLAVNSLLAVCVLLARAYPHPRRARRSAGPM